MIETDFISPERHIRIGSMLGEVLRRHAERVGLELESALSCHEAFPSYGVDFRDRLVTHGKAAAGRARTMHHEVRAGPAVRAIVCVGIAEVE